MSKRTNPISRLMIRDTLFEGKHSCRLCSWVGSYKSGRLTIHLKLCHSISIQEYSLTVLGLSNVCLCGCGKITAWEPRGGWFKEYVSGHNYRGKTKLNDSSVARRVPKMMANLAWQASIFRRGNVSWNTGLTIKTDVRLFLAGRSISYMWSIKSIDEKSKICRQIGETHSRNLKMGLVKSRLVESTLDERRLWAQKGLLTKASRGTYQATKGFRTGWFDSKKAGRVYYNSSYELEMMESYDSNDDVIFWSRCFFCIPYIHPDGRYRMYFPDFIFELKDYSVVVDETKGFIDDETISKALAAKDYFNQSGIKYRLFTKTRSKIGLFEVLI